MIRILQTSDWQLGMNRQFLSEEAQERFRQARFDSIRNIGLLAKEENCNLILVCGDTFESNQVDRKTVARALEILKDFTVPMYILPGNHDPLDAASVYRSSTFIDKKPAQVNVIENADIISVADRVELVGAPWKSKRPVNNPLEDALDHLEPAGDIYRICLGHGAVDTFVPDTTAAGVISITDLEKAIADHKVNFIALGDRHSMTQVGDTGCIWYSGTPESTGFRETDAGYLQIIDIDDGHLHQRAVRIGQWKFVDRERVDLNSSADIETLEQWLRGIENKDRTAVRLTLVGSLTLTASSALQHVLRDMDDVFASLEIDDDSLLIVPEDADFENLGFSGFADATVRELRNKMAEAGNESVVASEALLLMIRLAKEPS